MRTAELDTENVSNGDKGNVGGGLAGGRPEKLDLIYRISHVPDKEELDEMGILLFGIRLPDRDTST
jgi:hypothetical protein